MHPVIKHIKNRKNKSVPVNDGRKIALVLFGGLMTGVRGAGSVIALEELGLRSAFEEVYAISAGFANASYFLSGQTKMGTSIYYDELSGNKFIYFPRLWNICNVPYLMNVMRKVKPLNVKNIIKNPTKIFTRLKNLKTKKAEYVEGNKLNVNAYFKILNVSISMPYLNPGSTKIKGVNYKDPDLTDIQLIEHVQQVLQSDNTDILIIYNYQQQKKIINKVIKLPKNRVYEISPNESWYMNRICTDSKILKNETIKMGNRVKRILGGKSPIKLYKEV